MYYEEKVISGVLHYRYSANEDFKPFTAESLTEKYIASRNYADKLKSTIDIIEYKTIEAVKNLNN